MVDGLWRQLSDRYRFRALLGKEVTPAAMIAPDTSSGFCRQDHIDRKAHPFEVEHINSSRVRAPKLTRLASRLSLMRQNRR